MGKPTPARGRNPEVTPVSVTPNVTQPYTGGDSRNGRRSNTGSRDGRSYRLLRLSISALRYDPQRAERTVRLYVSL